MFALQLRVFTADLLELQGGMSQVVDRLADGLEVRYGTAVSRVEQGPEGVSLHAEDRAAPVRARAAVLACPADEAARMWPDAPEAVRDHLEGMDYSRIDSVYVRTDGPLEMSMEGRPLGIELLPTAEVGARTLSGFYFADRWAEDGGLMLLVAAVEADTAAMSDTELADRLQADAEALHPELAGRVTDRTVVRDERYTPTFAPGSVKRLLAARRELPGGRVDLAGDHMAAPWVEGAVRSGQMADRLAASLAVA